MTALLQNYCMPELSEDHHWDQYRGRQEPEQHWYLRKEFLKQNQGLVSEHLLFCLSSTFADIQLFGCKYPQGTRELIERLSVGIIQEYGSRFKDKARCDKRERGDYHKQGEDVQLAVEIPGASNSEATKLSHETRENEAEKSNYSVEVVTNSVSNLSLYPKKVNPCSGTDVSQKNVALQSLLRLEEEQETELGKNEASPEIIIPAVSTKLNTVIRNPKVTYGNVLVAIDRSNSVLFDVSDLMKYINDIYIFERRKATPKKTVVESFQFCDRKDYIRFKVEVDPTIVEGNSHKCELIFGVNTLTDALFRGEGSSAKRAKNNASEVALKFLRKLRPTIYITDDPAPPRKVKRSDIDLAGLDGKEEPGATNSDGSTFAVRMMQAMGWKGGGLGRNEDGISAPVSDLMVVKTSRTGFGFAGRQGLLMSEMSSSKDKGNDFVDLVQSFLDREKDSLFFQDIAFPSNFSKEERKTIHGLVQRMKLESKSFGTGAKRHLIISRKFKPQDIFERTMAAGGESPKYKVVLAQP